jgi:hypothetical protein
MPHYHTEVAHPHGRSEALARLKNYSDKARGFSDLDGSWNGDTFTFAVSVQGIRFSGTLQVRDEDVVADLRLPLLAMPFKGWLPKLLKVALKFPVDAERGSVPPSSRADDRGYELAPTVLFLHLPKAGGMSLGEFVYNECRSGDEAGTGGLLREGVLFLPYGFFKEDRLAVPQYARDLLGRDDLRAVIGHFWYGLHEHVRGPWTYITLLRHPVERVLSLYHFLKLEGTMSVADFAASPPFREADNDQTRRISGLDPELGGCTPAMLDLAKEHLRRDFAVAGVVERFDDTLALLRKRLGWNRGTLSYPRNVNDSRPAAESLPPAVVDAILSRNQLDLALWEFVSQRLDEVMTKRDAS